MNRALGLALIVVMAGVALAQAPAREAKLYTTDQIRQVSVEDLIAHLGQPEEGYLTNSARLALRAKAETDATTRQRILVLATQFARDVQRPIVQRSEAFYLLAAIDHPSAVPVLVAVLEERGTSAVRVAAAWALGQIKTPEAQEAFAKLLAVEKDPKVLEWMQKALDQPKLPPPPDPQKVVRFWLVKDWIRLRNTGPAATSVGFQRYFPTVDDEQLVIGRWVEGRGAAGSAVPVVVLKIGIDRDENPIHTIRLAAIGKDEEITITVTSIVARHAKAPPQPPCPVVAAHELPGGIRPYLAATATVPANDPEVVKQARSLLEHTNDAHAIVSQILQRLRSLPRIPTEKPRSHPELSVPAFTLRYGGYGAQSAATCAAVCRAAGIPARLTYYPVAMIAAGVDVYLSGYGWYRVQPATGIAFMPPGAFPLPRMLNLPIEAEGTPDGYMLPYHTGDGNWVVLADQQPSNQIRTWSAAQNGRLVQITEPFPHPECGTMAKPIGEEAFAGEWLSWDALRRISEDAVVKPELGAFAGLIEKLPSIQTYVDKGLAYREPAPEQ